MTETWKPRYNPWLVAVVVSMAAFMEVLDTDVANVALPYMAGGLAASNSESTWVLTSYLVSNAIVLPISGWLSDTFGRKRFFILCILSFTLASGLCGLTPTLGSLIFFRVLQGAFGGGLQPLAQAILADTFPPSQRGMAFALYGVTVVVAPTVGPVIGGWITDNYSWRWIFFINLPVGLLATGLVRKLVEDPPFLKKAAGAGVKIDYIGLALLTLGIGALQVVLDKGQENDWFGSRLITTLVILAVVCLTALAIWEWRHKHPVIEVRLLKIYNFAAASMMMFFLGLLYFAGLVMMPLFVQTLMGYTAEKAGLVLGFGGFVAFCELPVVGWLTTKVQARQLIAFGWLVLAISSIVTALQLDLLISYSAVRNLRVLQALGLGFLFVPINLAAYIGISAEKGGSISGIMNFWRNLGSSFGTSMVTTLLDRRAEFHNVHLVDHATRFDAQFQSTIDALSQRLGDAQHAYAQAYKSLLAQASNLAYIDIFWLLTVMSFVMLLLCSMLKRNEPGSEGGGAGIG